MKKIIALSDIKDQNVLGCFVPLKDKEKYLEAVRGGYKDEVCGKCFTYFAPYFHLIKCDNNDCPMKEGHSLLEMIFSEPREKY